MIPNSSTRLFQEKTFKPSSTKTMWVTHAINLGEPRGAFSLGIPAARIAGDSHYLAATEHQVTLAASRAARALPGETSFPVVGQSVVSYTESNILFTDYFNPFIALCQDGVRVGYAEPSAVSDPIFVKNDDGTYKPIAYMVFKEKIKGGLIEAVPVGYRLEDQSYKSQMHEGDLYQGPTDKLSRRDDGNWVLPVETNNTDLPGLRHRGNVHAKVTDQPQDAKGTGEKRDNLPEEADGNDAESSETSASEPRGTVIGKFTFTYDTVDDENNLNDLLDSESESESENADSTIYLGTGGVARSPQLSADAIRTELIQGGIPGRGMWTLAGMGVLLSIGIVAKLSYDIYNRRTPQPYESNPNFDSTVTNAFERCAIELGFDLTAGDKDLIADLVGILKDCLGKRLGNIEDIGALLKCPPDELVKDLGAIYGSFDGQMRAIAATAGLLSPSACLIMLSLVFLFTYGAI